MSKPSSSLIEYIYRTAGLYRDDVSSDAELLKRYTEVQDEQAFGTLMVRHGMMIWRICRRILDTTQDAEEAYQSTFLALACKASKIRLNEPLVGWLHQVAHRTALAARRKIRVRQDKKKGLKDVAQHEENIELAEAERYEALHGAIAKMPESLRVPLVLHYLEGKTQSQVADMLGVDESAVWHRLARAKVMLEKRLGRHGLAITSATLSSLLAESASSAAMPPGLVSKTVKAATAFRDGKLTGGLAKLAQEVLKHTPMSSPWWKTGWMITIMCIGGLGVGASGVAWRAGFLGPKSDGESLTVANKEVEEAPPADQKRSKTARLDAYGDPLPEGSLARLGTVRFRLDQLEDAHSNITVTADKKLFLPKARALPAVYPLRCYDLTTGKPLHEFKDAEGRMLGFDPDLTLSFDGRLLAQKIAPSDAFGFWDLAAGKQLKLTTKTRSHAIAMCPKGKLVAAVTETPGSAGPLPPGFNLCVWDDTAGRKQWTKHEKSITPLKIAYSPDGKLLMAACWPKPTKPGLPKPAKPELMVRRWEAATGKELASWTLPAVLIRFGDSLTWSHDGGTLAVMSETFGNTISVWDMIKGIEIQQIRIDSSYPVDMATTTISPDGTVLAVRINAPGAKKPLCFWDTATGKLLQKWDCPACSPRLRFSTDGKCLVVVPTSRAAVIDHFIQIWDIASGKLVNQVWDEKSHKYAPTSLVFSRRSETLASSDQGGGVTFWNENSARDGYSISRPKASLERRLYRSISTISPSTKIVAFGGYDHSSDHNDPFHVRLWQVAADETTESIRLKDLLAKEIKPWLFRFSPDNQLLGITALDPAIHALRVFVYNTNTWKRIDKGEMWGSTLTFSPNGEWIAVGENPVNGSPRRGGFYLWSTVTGKMVAADFHGPVFDISFSPDGRGLAVSSQPDGSHDVVSLWQIHDDGTNMWLEEPRCHMVTASLGAGFSLLTFSPDGRTLAAKRNLTRDNGRRVSDVAIHVWETVTGEERYVFNDHGSPVTSLAFAADGRRMASGHENTTILIWDVSGRWDKGKLKAAPISDQIAASLWNDLAGNDARQAGRAVWALISVGDAAVPFLGKRTHRVKGEVPSPKLLDQLIHDLGVDAFQVRMRAHDALAKLGEPAESAVRQALSKKLSLDVRRRLEVLLTFLVGKRKEMRAKEIRSPEFLGPLRAIEVLEQIGTVSAKKLLQHLAAGMPTASQTKQAQAALARLMRVED